MPIGKLFIAFCLFVLTACVAVAEEKQPVPLLQKSLPYRTALHHDPTLQPPLRELLDMYRAEGRTDELLGMYKQHVQQYPTDAKARVVLYKLLHQSGQVESDVFLKKSVEVCPQSGLLHFLLAEVLHSEGQGEGRELLIQAIDKEPLQIRQQEWIFKLIEWSAQSGDKKSIAQGIERWRKLTLSSSEQIELGQLLLRHHLGKEALTVLSTLSVEDAEDKVSLEILLARAEAKEGKIVEAAQRLDHLLEKLDGRYWRRQEILAQRFGLISGKDEIEKAIKQQQDLVNNNATSEQAWLDLAQIQMAFNRGQSALETLKQAHAKLPSSGLVEKALIDQYEHLQLFEPLEEWLQEKIKNDESRKDLQRRRVELLYLFERNKEAVESFERLLQDVDEKTKMDQRLSMSRKLRQFGLVLPAMNLLEKVLEKNSSRFDLLRELLEIQHQLNPSAVFSHLTDKRLKQDASVEQVVDLGRWLNAKGFFPQSATLLEYHLKAYPYHPDLNTLLVTVYRRMGLRDKQKERLTVLRKDINSIADYRRLLIALVEGEKLERRSEIIKKEILVIEGMAQSDLSVQMEVALIEMLADDSDQLSELTDYLTSKIQNTQHDNWRMLYRRQLVHVLSRQSTLKEELVKHLNILIEEDPLNKIEYTVKLLSAKISKDRSSHYYRDYQENKDLLQTIDIAKVTDEATLRSLLSIFTKVSDPDKKEKVLKKLVSIKNADINLWQEWLNFMATSKMEEKLQVGLRRLLANRDVLKITPEQQHYCHDHLLQSLWRTISSRVVTNDLEGALVLLNQAEDAAKEQDLLWILWTRAVLLNQLNRDVAFKQTRERLMALSQQIEENQYIIFPDGLRCNIDVLHHQFVSSPKAIDNPEKMLLPPYELSWTGQIEGRLIAAIEIDNELMVVSTDAVIGFDLESGKRSWSENVSFQGASASHVNYNVVYDQFSIIPNKGVVVSTSDDVVCIGKGGVIHWRVKLETPLYASVAVYDDMAYVVERRSGDVYALNTGTGKIIWYNKSPLEVEEQPQQTHNRYTRYSSSYSRYGHHTSTPSRPGNGRLSVSNDLILVAHKSGRILNRETGKIIWDFTQKPKVKLPIKIESAKDAPPGINTQSQLVRRRYSGSRYGTRHQAAHSEIHSWFSSGQGSNVYLKGHWLVSYANNAIQCRSLMLPVLKTKEINAQLIRGIGARPIVRETDRLLRLDDDQSVYCRSSMMTFKNGKIFAMNDSGLTIYNANSLTVLAHGVWPEEVQEFFVGSSKEDESAEPSPEIAALLERYKRYQNYVQSYPQYQYHLDSITRQLHDLGWSNNLKQYQIEIAEGSSHKHIYLLRGDRILALRGAKQND